MKSSRLLSPFLLFLLPFLGANGVKAQDYTGTFQLETGDVTLTLTIQQDAINGYNFTVPEGWVHQKADGQILMGSHTIAGIISVSPHQARSMQELQGLMSQGLQEEGIYLTPEGAFQQQTRNMASGYYNGSVQ